MPDTTFRFPCKFIAGAMDDGGFIAWSCETCGGELKTAHLPRSCLTAGAQQRAEMRPHAQKIEKQYRAASLGLNPAKEVERLHETSKQRRRAIAKTTLIRLQERNANGHTS